MLNGKYTRPLLMIMGAYSLPILIAMAVSRDGVALCGFIAMVINFIVFAVMSGLDYVDEERLKRSAFLTLVFGVIVALITLVAWNAYPIWLTVAIFAVSMAGYSLRDN